MITISTDKSIEIQVHDGCGHHFYDVYLPANSLIELQSGCFINITPDPLSIIKKYIKK